MSVERQRGIMQEQLRIAEHEARELPKKKPGATDLLALDRLANTVLASRQPTPSS